MKKAQPLISSPNGTISIKKMISFIKKTKYRKKERGKTKDKGRKPNEKSFIQEKKKNRIKEIK
jgi:hypothetical protein